MLLDGRRDEAPETAAGRRSLTRVEKNLHRTPIMMLLPNGSDFRCGESHLKESRSSVSLHCPTILPKPSELR